MVIYHEVTVHVFNYLLGTNAQMHLYPGGGGGEGGGGGALTCIFSVGMCRGNDPPFFT